MRYKMQNSLTADERQKRRGPERDRGSNYSGSKHQGPKASHWSSRLREHIGETERKVATSPKWPFVSVEDCALGSSDAHKIIRIIAPGVGEDEIRVEVLPNGAR